MRTKNSDDFVPATPIQSAIALSCLISVVFAVALVSSNASPPKATLIWLIYVAICGVAINRSNAITLRKSALYSIAPSLTMLASFIFMYIVGLFMSGDLIIPMGSGGTAMPENGVSSKWLGFYGAIFVATVPAIGVACVASQSIIEMFVKIDEIPLSKIVSLKSKITAVIAIVGLIISFIIIGLK
jgi:hypothetical protein